MTNSYFDANNIFRKVPAEITAMHGSLTACRRFVSAWSLGVRFAEAFMRPIYSIYQDTVPFLNNKSK